MSLQTQTMHNLRADEDDRVREYTEELHGAGSLATRCRVISGTVRHAGVPD